MTIARASRLFRTSKLTSQQLCNHSHNLAVFGEKSLLLNAYAKLLPLDEILQQAKQSDERIQNGTPKSLLDGIPVTIKANIAVGKYWELPNACSNILSTGWSEGGEQNDNTNKRKSISEDITTTTCTNNNNKYVYESDIARRLLRECGAVIIGITNMDEFGMGSLGINNGLVNNSSSSSTQKLLQQQKNNYSPTYNPIPWMQRISALIGSQHIQHINCDDFEEVDLYWLQQIQNSSPENPHGIKDEDSLSDLLDEVQYWVCGNTNCTEQGEKENNAHNNGNDISPLLSAGGSSSGAAAATAHRSSLLSLGTDTGGSLRLPSSWTSTIGFKPTYGTWSRYGVVSYASSLDTVGFITGSTECAEIAWQCLGYNNNNNVDDGNDTNKWNGQLGRDATARVYHKKNNRINTDSYGTTAADTDTKDTKPLTNIRVGIPSAFSLQELPPLIAKAWSESANNLQKNGGATLVSVSESTLSSELIKLALASYYVLACAEASSNLSRYDGVRYGMDFNLLDDASNNINSSGDDDSFPPLDDMTTLEQQISATRAYGLGEEVQRRIIAGTSVLSSDRFHTHYEAAAVVRAKLCQSLENTFRSSLNDNDEHDEKVDVMLVPTALSFPCRLDPLHDKDGKMMKGIDPTAAFANDVMTIPISLGGFPSISVPVGDGGNQSMIGMQLFASRESEDLILRVANTLHR